MDPLGNYKAQIDLNDYDRLARFIGRTGFFGWESEYVAGHLPCPMDLKSASSARKEGQEDLKTASKAIRTSDPSRLAPASSLR